QCGPPSHLRQLICVLVPGRIGVLISRQYDVPRFPGGMNAPLNRIDTVTEPLSLPRLVATTREIDPVDALLYADGTSPVAWTRHGDGLVAAGPDLLHIDVAEDGRIAAIADLWRAIAQATDVDDDV